jgi:DNA mismatch repair protein MutS
MPLKRSHFQTVSLRGFGIEDLKKVSLHLEHIVLFVETQHNGVQHITSIQRIAEDAYVWMDRFTIRRLYHSYNQMR